MATKKTYEEIPPIVKNYDTYLCRLLFVYLFSFYIQQTIMAKNGHLKFIDDIQTICYNFQFRKNLSLAF